MKMNQIIPSFCPDIYTPAALRLKQKMWATPNFSNRKITEWGRRAVWRFISEYLVSRWLIAQEELELYKELVSVLRERLELAEALIANYKSAEEILAKNSRCWD